MKKNILYILGIALLFHLLISCKDSNSDNNPSGPDEENPSQWLTETISISAKSPVVALDNNNNPHISFLDAGYVKYASRNSGNWDIETVGKVSNAGGTYANGGISALAVDAFDRPHISYYDYGNICFQYAVKNEGGWNITPVALPNDPKMSYDSPFIPWAESSIIIDKNSGMVHIAFQMLGGLSGYVMGYWNSTMMTALIADGDGTNIGYQNSIALDNNGWPAISYEDRGNNILKYAQWNGAGFDVQNISAMPNVYWREHLTSLDIDNDNNAHIAFYGHGGYKYAVQNNNTWLIDMIPFDSGYPALSLSLDNTDCPQIAFVSLDTGSSYRLKYSCLDNSDWLYNNVEDGVNHCSVTTGSDGKIALVYETNDNILKYTYNK